MDPKEVLVLALEYLLNANNEADPTEASYCRHEAAYHLRVLADWISAGGFVPNVASADWDWPRKEAYAH